MLLVLFAQSLVLGESDNPAFGSSARLSLHLAISSNISVGSVYKSKGDHVVRVWVQLMVEEIMCVVCVDVTEGA